MGSVANATVVGGANNIASGTGAVVSGGIGNEAGRAQSRRERAAAAAGIVEDQDSGFRRHPAENFGGSRLPM